WRAYVDDVATDTVMLMPSYVGVKVPSGAHHVRVEYQPGRLRGTFLFTGLMVLMLIALAEWRPRDLAWSMRKLRLASVPAILGKGVRRGASWGPCLAAREAIIRHLPYVGGVVLVTLLAGLPLLQFRIMGGHDALEYLPRSVEFWEGLKAGQVFPRWAPDLSAGYGQPFFNFNPPLFYYVSSLFYLLGFSFVAAQSLACFALLLLAGLGMYLLAREFFGPRGGLVSAVAYLFAPYLLVTLYVRHALADFCAFAFIPLALWGLYRLAQNAEHRFLLVGAISAALLLLSSNPLALISFPAFLLFAGWLAYIRKSWRVLVRCLWCLVLGLGLAAFFWLPALAERGFVHVDRLLGGYLNYGDHFVYLHQFFFSPWGHGLSLAGPVDGMSFAIGVVHLLAVAVALLLLWRMGMGANRESLVVSFFVMLVFVAVFFASNASSFLWQWIPLLPYLEFPWRFLALVAASTAFICGFPVLVLKSGDKRLTNGLMGGIIVALLVLNFPHARPERFLEARDTDYGPREIAARDIAVTTAREYEPVWVRERPRSPVGERLVVMEGNARVAVVRVSPTHYEFLAVVTERARLRVNTFYFPGWSLSVNRVEQPVDYSNPQGLMEFTLEPGDHHVQVHFGDTPIRFWATAVSFLALLLMLLTPVMPGFVSSRLLRKRGRP
ncbi:MAG: glycosyltransferase family 39 protein, partial [Chloroflexota bacterium]